MRQSLNLLDPMGEIINISGSPVPGAGWYGPNTGLHSVSIRVLNFQGRVRIQASLATTPGDNDWFSVLPDGAAYLQYPQSSYVPAGETSTTGFNFIHNVIWVRAIVDRSYLTSGTETPVELAYLGVVDGILLNY